jgi:hypothetical protein
MAFQISLQILKSSAIKLPLMKSDLWHQRLGHLNFTNMFKIASKEVVKDLPKMKDTGKGVCGPW